MSSDFCTEPLLMLTHSETEDEDVYYTYNGRIVTDLTEVPTDAIVQKHYRLRGGKGGFGSMLRAIGSQIEKTTNHEMCRDLSGRRMRDVNTERKLREWYANASEREREKMEKYYERRRKRQEILSKGPLPGHKFSDREYERQKRKIAHDLQSALDEAIGKIVKEKSSGVTASTSNDGQSAKKPRLWIEEMDGSLSSSTSSDSEENVDVDQNTNHASEEILPVQSPTENKIPSTSDLANNQSEPDLSNVIQHTVTENSAPSEPEPIVEQTASTTSSAEPQNPPAEALTDSQLEAVPDAKHLESFGLDVLKQSLIVRGLKCGGTLSERATRLFAVRGLQPENFPAKLKAKGK